MSEPQITASPELWQIVCEQIYRQHRRNKARGMSDRVDVLATEPYADMFHEMLEQETRTRFAIPGMVKYEKIHLHVIGMRCRIYEPMLFTHPCCEVSVCIPDPKLEDVQHVFAIPDYEAMTYYDFLTNETRPFPQFKQAVVHEFIP